MNIVQIAGNGRRTVALVDGNRLRLLHPMASDSVYALAQEAIVREVSLQDAIEQLISKDAVDYDEVYEGKSAWRLLPSFDNPSDPAQCMVSGTGLTHKASAENRAAMHERGAGEITDSMRMYRLGLEGGKPAAGEIGVQPEWFYKGDGSLLRACGEDLEVPAYALDGGEEPEIAGVYVISADGEAYRVGLTVGNEFSDHKMEKLNYLYLAPSKLRNCSIGPELVIGEAAFENVSGSVRIVREEEVVWRSDIFSGRENMSYSVENLEHHHFKYAGHRRPGACHVHFFGADAFSFGAGVELKDGDRIGLHPYAETQKLGTGNCSLILALQIWFLIAE
jgi:hypothetical protein